MRHRYSYLIVLSLTLVLAACGGQTTSDVDVTGTWSGQMSDPLGKVPIVMMLTQEGTSINGTLILEGGRSALSGTTANDTVSLVVEGETITFDGSVTSNTIQGETLLSLSNGISGTGVFSVTRQ